MMVTILLIALSYTLLNPLQGFLHLRVPKDHMKWILVPAYMLRDLKPGKAIKSSDTQLPSPLSGEILSKAIWSKTFGTSLKASVGGGIKAVALLFVTTSLKGRKQDSFHYADPPQSPSNVPCTSLSTGLLSPKCSRSP